MQLLRRSLPTSKHYDEQRIVLLGPANVGKTTYIATLLYWEDSPHNEYFRVTGIDEDAILLKEQAQNLLCQGRSLQPTRVREVFDVKKYGLGLEVYPQPHHTVELTLRCADYPGEVFEAMQYADPDQELNRHQPQNESFMDEIFAPEISGCMIFLDAWLDDRPPLP